VTADARNDLLHELLAWPTERLSRPVDNHASWRKLWESDAISRRSPIERSIVGGFLSDRLAWAFASGYQGAIRQLIPALPQGNLAAFCITESGGNHPRVIQTRLTRTNGGYRINGEKQFVSGGEHADRLMAAASTGMVDGRNQLRLVIVEKREAGVIHAPMAPLPFIPELRHSRVRFIDVFIPENRLLPGDGYTAYIKPFRTVEDLHVAGAVLGYLFRIGRRFGWPETMSAQIIALIEVTMGLARQNLSAPHILIAVDGLFCHLEKLTASLAELWQQVSPDVVVRWHRDRAVLKVADGPRAMRRSSAWKCYQQGPPPMHR
jgi:hypothetical protein